MVDLNPAQLELLVRKHAPEMRDVNPDVMQHCMNGACKDLSARNRHTGRGRE